MTASSSATVRVPVSLRLPADIAKSVEDHARKAHIRKTDSYLHFLKLGLESEGAEKDEARLAAIEEKIEEIASMLAERQAAGRTGAPLPAVTRAVQDSATAFDAISRVYLFGSMARGTADASSDIDLRLELNRSKRFNLHDLEHFCKHIEQATGRRVDAITATVIGNKALAEAIERDKVLIYERKEH